MNLLARREHSRAELERKLQARECDFEEISAVLTALERDNLLSDSRFAEAFVDSRLSRGDGPMKIQHRLRQRGVESAIADVAINNVTVDWVARAARERVKRFGADAPHDYHERARQSRFLSQRGFTSSQIRGSFDESDEDEF